MSYRTQRPHPAPHRGRAGTAYQDACAVVRKRAEAGEPCYFWRQPHYEDCPGGFDWTLHALFPNHRWAFTAHHLHRLMDGGPPVPDPALMAPAHRACNARDGLRAQNARRAGLSTITIHPTERTSRPW